MAIKITSSDRETARQLCEALVVTRRAANVEEVARILAFLRDQTISCALVDARREREREAAGHAAWCRTDGCDGSCREADVERLDEATILVSPRTEAKARDEEKLRVALALLYDAACYPNADIDEAQIESARDTIALALGLRKARMTKVVHTRKRGPADAALRTKGTR